MLNYFIGDYYADCAILYTYLLEMKEHIVSSTDRNKMMYVNKKLGGSALYGHTWKSYLSKTKNKTPSPLYKGLSQTKLVDLYPWFHHVATEFSGLYFPDFVWSQIQINRNFQCPEHLDSTNQGESVIIGLGDYTGGDLVINKSEGNKLRLDFHDVSEKPIRFDGSKFKHYTSDFDGDRYSLVFFNNIKNIETKLK